MTGVRPHTIKLILAKKMRGLIDSIEDEKIARTMVENIVISGGAITSLLLGERPNDYDVYFKTKRAVLDVADYYVERQKERIEVKEESVVNIKGIAEERVKFFIKSTGIEFVDAEEKDTLTEEAYKWLEESPDEAIEVIKLRLKEGKYHPIVFTDNAVSLSNKIQIIIRFWGTPKELHENFDFVHAMCWYDYDRNHLELPEEALLSILTKSLIYKGSLYPLASLFRIRKFMKRGWRISAGQILKIAMQVSQLDLKNPDVLREQLIGVDQAYMNMMVMRLTEAKASEQADTA